MLRRIVRLSFCTMVFASLLAGCRSAALVTPQPVTLRVGGSSSFAAALAELGQAYQESHPEVLIDVQSSDSQAGLQALQAGDIDLAAVSWLAPQTTLPAGLAAVPAARDAIAIIVHPTNPVQAMTLLQLRALYAGEAIDWGAFGGPALEPAIISREDGSGTRAAFEAIVMGEQRPTLNALVMPSTQAVVDYVATHPTSVGYASAGAAASAGEKVRIVSIENALPGRAAVQAGAYHLSQVVYLVRSNRSSAAAEQFIDFVLSPAGQAIVARHHVPLR